MAELKQALETAGLPVTGKKARHGGELLVTEAAGMILSISSFKAFRNLFRNPSNLLHVQIPGPMYLRDTFRRGGYQSCQRESC